MNKQRTSTLVTIGIIALVILFGLNVVKAGNASTRQVAAATAHFTTNRTYLLVPANGTGTLRCKAIDVDGAWLKCDGPKVQWINTNVMMFASDSQ